MTSLIYLGFYCAGDLRLKAAFMIRIAAGPKVRMRPGTPEQECCLLPKYLTHCIEMKKIQMIKLNLQTTKKEKSVNDKSELPLPASSSPSSPTLLLVLLSPTEARGEQS